jgi:hypothetical protein
MITSVALGLVISFEPHEADVMRRLPSELGRPVLDTFGMWRVVFVSVALLVFTLGAFFWTKSYNSQRTQHHRQRGRSRRLADGAASIERHGSVGCTRVFHCRRLVSSREGTRYTWHGVTGRTVGISLAKASGRAGISYRLSGVMKG